MAKNVTRISKSGEQESYAIKDATARQMVSEEVTAREAAVAGEAAARGAAVAGEATAREAAVAGEAAAREAADVELKNAIYPKDLKSYLYRDKCYMTTDESSITPNDNMCICKIELQPGAIVYLKQKDMSVPSWPGFAVDYRGIVVANNVFMSLYGNTPYGKTNDYEIIAVARPGVSAVYFNMLRDKFDTVDFYLWRAGDNDDPRLISDKDAARKVTVENSIPVDTIWMSYVNDQTQWNSMVRTEDNIRRMPLCMYLPVAAGQRFIADKTPQSFGSAAVYNALDDSIQEATGSDYVAPKDGIICVYRNIDDPNTVIAEPKESIKIRYKDIIDHPEPGVHNDLKPYLYRDNCYMTTDESSITPYATMCICKINLQLGDIVYLRQKDMETPSWPGFAADYRGIVVANGVFMSLYGNTPYGKTNDYEIIVVARPGVSAVYFNMVRDKFDTVDFYFWHANDNDDPRLISDRDVARKVTVEDSIPVDTIWMSYVNDQTQWNSMMRTEENVRRMPLCMYLPVKAGQRFVADKNPQGFATAGVYNALDDTVQVSIESDYTAPKDGIICVYRNIDDPNTVIAEPKESIKIRYNNIIDPPEGKIQILDGVKVVTFGDSITNLNLWQPMIADVLGGTWAVCAIGSTPLSGSNDYAFWKDVRLNAVKTENPGLVTILGGANDLVQNPVIGQASDLESKNTSTFIGAYSYIIDNLLSWKPTLKIIILSTTWAHNDGADVTETTVRYKDYAAACKLVAEHYKLPYVDLYNESGFNAYTMNSGANAVYSNDHIHPNTAGASIIASMVAAKMKEIFSMV